jgi:hypothetical protein
MKKFLLPVFILFTIFSVSAQKIKKKPLDHSAYDGWQSIDNEHISNNGKWVIYVIKPQEGDADLFITNTKNNKFRVPRADTARFTSDSKYTVMLIRPFFKDIARQRSKRKNLTNSLRIHWA